MLSGPSFAGSGVAGNLKLEGGKFADWDALELARLFMDRMRPSPCPFPFP